MASVVAMSEEVNQADQGQRLSNQQNLLQQRQPEQQNESHQGEFSEHKFEQQVKFGLLYCLRP